MRAPRVLSDGRPVPIALVEHPASWRLYLVRILRRLMDHDVRYCHSAGDVSVISTIPELVRLRGMGHEMEPATTLWQRVPIGRLHIGAWYVPHTVLGAVVGGRPLVEDGGVAVNSRVRRS